MTVVLKLGDAVEHLRAGRTESIDAVVTDPPYELGFMGKGWDASGIANSVELWTEVLRVLKPGGHLLSFGATRTYHRMACAVEDAGFEIRDTIAWTYGSGFPKSLDVSKAIDKAVGAERPVIGQRPQRANTAGAAPMNASVGDVELLTAPATADAVRWQGWGTALKPAYEPVVVARKPFRGTVAANVLAHGTGALNIDGTRIATEEPRPDRERRSTGKSAPGGFTNGARAVEDTMQGRWPANLILDEEAAAVLDAQSGYLKTGTAVRRNVGHSTKGLITYAQGSKDADMREDVVAREEGGGASRFFYVAKASTLEKNAGLDGGTPHPTVKPIALMRYLVRLVTPPGGRVLDPFMGSGTTGIACVLEGFDFVGIDESAEYAEVARRRIAHWTPAPEAAA